MENMLSSAKNCTGHHVLILLEMSAMCAMSGGSICEIVHVHALRCWSTCARYQRSRHATCWPILYFICSVSVSIDVSGVAKILNRGLESRRSSQRNAEGVERGRGRGREWRGGFALPSQLASSARPKLNFIQSGCQRSHLVTRIALNFHSKQRLSLLRKTIVLFKLHGENFFAQAMRGVNPHQPLPLATPLDLTCHRKLQDKSQFNKTHNKRQKVIKLKQIIKLSNSPSAAENKAP